MLGPWNVSSILSLIIYSQGGRNYCINFRAVVCSGANLAAVLQVYFKSWYKLTTSCVLLSFHCLFCHGYEERGAESAGLLAEDAAVQAEMLTHVAHMALRLSKKLTVYTNGHNDDKVDEIWTNSDIPDFKTRITVEKRPIKQFKLVSLDASDVLVMLEDGTEIRESFIVRCDILLGPSENDLILRKKGSLKSYANKPLNTGGISSSSTEWSRNSSHTGSRDWRGWANQDSSAVQRDKCARRVCCW